MALYYYESRVLLCYTKRDEAPSIAVDNIILSNGRKKYSRIFGVPCFIVLPFASVNVLFLN